MKSLIFYGEAVVVHLKIHRKT